MPFVHLRAPTDYAVVDGTLRIPDAAAARADQQPALAITDPSKLSGAIRFYKAWRRQGVKPITGAAVFLAPEAACSGAASSQRAGCTKLSQVAS